MKSKAPKCAPPVSECIILLYSPVDSPKVPTYIRRARLALQGIEKAREEWRAKNRKVTGGLFP